MNIQEEISKIQTERYGDYKAANFRHLKEFHEEIRQSAGDERFLKFLQQIVKDNPKPVFNMPDYLNVQP